MLKKKKKKKKKEKEDVETSRNKYVCAQKSLAHHTHATHQGSQPTLIAIQ